METPLSRSDVKVMIQGEVGQIKESLASLVALLGKAQSSIHNNKIGIEELRKKMTAFEKMDTKLFDEDNGIITRYLEDARDRRRTKHELRIGIILTIC